MFCSYPMEVIQGQGSECSWFLQHKHDADNDELHVEFAGGNVHLVTTKESWDQKLSEASRDGKIVSLIFVRARDYYFSVVLNNTLLCVLAENYSLRLANF